MMTKDKMVDVLRETGMSKEQMERLHRVFETKYPDDHQAFLEWLGLPATEVNEIRRQSR